MIHNVGLLIFFRKVGVAVAIIPNPSGIPNPARPNRTTTSKKNSQIDILKALFFHIKREGNKFVINNSSIEENLELSNSKQVH